MNQDQTLTFVSTPDMARLLGAADAIAAADQRSAISPRHLIIAMLHDPSLIPARELEAGGLPPDVALNKLASLARQALTTGVAGT